MPLWIDSRPERPYPGRLHRQSFSGNHKVPQRFFLGLIWHIINDVDSDCIAIKHHHPKNTNLRFRYLKTIGQSPDAYEALILDILNSDPTLFVRGTGRDRFTTSIYSLGRYKTSTEEIFKEKTLIN